MSRAWHVTQPNTKMTENATQLRHCLQPSPTTASMITRVCDKGQCSYCGDQLTFEQMKVLTNRPIVLKYEGRIGYYLYLCTHCTYHHVRVIPEKHRFHWSQEGMWSKLGAPLDIDTARAFCRMLGDEKETYLAVIVL